MAPNWWKAWNAKTGEERQRYSKMSGGKFLGGIARNPGGGRDVRQIGATSEELLRNSANPNKDAASYSTSTYHPQRQIATGLAPARPVPQWAPEQASEATRRFLIGVPTGPAAARGGELAIQPGTERQLSSHTYGLTPWQREQAELDFGARATAQQKSGPQYRTGTIAPEQLATLNDSQRKALQWNDLLLAAVEKDRGLKAGTPREDDYDDRVAYMFGTQGGSAMYAPNTMKLLETAGIGDSRALRGQDLDEYLSLDKAFTSDELLNLEPWTETPAAPTDSRFGAARSQEREALLAQRTAGLTRALIDDAVADAPGWDFDSRLASVLGQPRPSADQIPLGYLLPGESRTDPKMQQLDEIFQSSYEMLSSKTGSPDMSQFWLGTQQLGFTDAEYQQIFDYFQRRSLDDDRTGAGGGDTRTGAEMRQLLGIGG